MRLNADRRARALDGASARIVSLIADQEPIASDFALRLAGCVCTCPAFWPGLRKVCDVARAEVEFGTDIDARVQPSGA